MKRTTKALILLVAGTGMLFPSFAQNARINALGGAAIVDDYSRILYNPALLNSYKNESQINFNGGAIMGIKSAGSFFSMGAVMNRGLMLRSFYSEAADYLDYPPYTIAQTSEIPGASAMHYFPHVLWGFDLATVQIGFDAFLEWDRWSYNSTLEVPGAFQQIDEVLYIMHPGLMTGFVFDMPSVRVMLHAGGGLPMANGTVERTNITPIGIAKIETESALFARGGVEVTGKLPSADITFGADARYEKFQFSRLAPIAGASKVRSNKIKEITGIPYLGTTLRLSHGIMAVAMGASVIDILNWENDTGTEDTTEYDLAHSLIGGIEKQFQKPWKFDSLALRGGVNWSASHYWATIEGTSPIRASETVTPVATLGPMYPYVGCGVSKNFFTLDLLINPASWSGAFAGPAVSRVTVSLRY